eukprot:4356865-Amphidinium_carterae.1
MVEMKACLATLLPHFSFELAIDPSAVLQDYLGIHCSSVNQSAGKEEVVKGFFGAAFIELVDVQNGSESDVLCKRRRAAENQQCNLR